MILPFLQEGELKRTSTVAFFATVVNGNKRIAATLFLWFMENNGILYGQDGRKRIADNALVALTLMIAESRMDEMDSMLKLTVSLINSRNE